MSKAFVLWVLALAQAYPATERQLDGRSKATRFTSAEIRRDPTLSSGLRPGQPAWVRILYSFDEQIDVGLEIRNAEFIRELIDSLEIMDFQVGQFDLGMNMGSVRFEGGLTCEYHGQKTWVVLEASENPDDWTVSGEATISPKFADKLKEIVERITRFPDAFSKPLGGTTILPP